jgi:hypothetical protein
MTGFDNTLREVSLAILKRELTENERLEFLDLAGTMGVNDVQDYLYLLMVFKRNEDRIGGQLFSFRKEMAAKFEAMSALEKKIDHKLESTISKILSDGAREIGRDMGNHIAESAKDALKGYEEFHLLRGQILAICLISCLAAFSYWLGTGDVLGVLTHGRVGYLREMLRIPASGVMFMCGLLYVMTWILDHWYFVKRYVSYKVTLTLKILVLLALLLHVL